jgi:hypothetical protein
MEATKLVQIRLIPNAAHVIRASPEIALQLANRSVEADADGSTYARNKKLCSPDLYVQSVPWLVFGKGRGATVVVGAP